MLSYECLYLCMQMRAAIIEKPNFVNIWKTMHDNIMKLVSTHMFPWSRIIILPFKMLYYNMHIVCMQMRTAIIEKQFFFNIWKNVHYNNHENGVYIYVSLVKDYHNIT